MNPGAARPVSRVAVSAARKGAESDEETGVRRGHARPDRPRLHADGARIRQARGGGPPGARTLVPDGTRDVPGPEAAAVCAGASGELIRSRHPGAEFAPGQLAGMEIAGTRNPRRKARYSGSPGGNQDHQPGRTGLRSAYRRAFPACSGPVCVTFMRGRAANDPPGPADNRGLLARSGRCILPAICPVCSPACRSLVRPFERPRSHGPRTNSPAGSIDSQAGPALMPRARASAADVFWIYAKGHR